MKTTKIQFALALLSGVLITSNADKVQLQQLAPELQTKIRAQLGGQAVDDIDRNVRNGKITYEVGYKQAGQQKELVFNDKGELLNPDGSSITSSGKIKWDQLPESVKRTAQTRLNARMVDDIDRDVKNGKTTYQIGFKQGGIQKELLLSDDGKILQDSQLPPAVASGIGTPAASTSPNRVTRPLTLSEVQTVPMNWAPASVVALINSNAGGSAITQFQKGKWRGRTVYQATYQMNGQPVQFQIGEDGKVVYDPRSPTSVGVPAGSVLGTASSQASNSLVPLSSAEKVDRRSVPAAVERAIQTYAGNNSVEDIDRGAWQGRNVYQIAFKDNGRHVELQIDENGNLIFDPRTTNQ